MKKLFSFACMLLLGSAILTGCSSTDEDFSAEKYSLQGTTQGRYLTGGVPPVRFSM